MRKIESTDFEATNVEYIEFWMMDPFADAPKRLFIVHGEPEAPEGLRERVQRELGWQATVPLQGQEFEL